MDAEPELCITAVVYAGAMIFNNEGLTTGARTALDDLIESIQDNDDRNRYANMSMFKQLGPRWPIEYQL